MFCRSPWWRRTSSGSVMAIPAIQLAVCLLVSCAGRPQASIDSVDLLADLGAIPASVRLALCTPLVPMMFGRARRTGDALSIAEKLLSQGDLTCAVALGAAVVVDRYATSIDRDRWEKLSSAVIAVAAPGSGRAAAHYSLANGAAQRSLAACSAHPLPTGSGRRFFVSGESLLVVRNRRLPVFPAQIPIFRKVLPLRG